MSAVLVTGPTPARVRRRATALRADNDEAVVGPSWLEARVAELGLPVRASTAATVAPAAMVFGLLLALLLLGPAGAGLLALGLVGTILTLRRSAPRRHADAAERALPGVLDAVARHLRGGATLAQALPAARPAVDAGALRASWDRLTDLVPLVGVSAALTRWSSGTNATASLDRSVRLAAAALGLAATTGGSPARAIDGVAATLRSRLAVADEVRALSTQARASAVVISVAPLVFGGLAGLTDARTRSFLASPPGLVLLAIGAGLDALGAWWMARLCRRPDQR